MENGFTQLKNNENKNKNERQLSNNSQTQKSSYYCPRVLNAPNRLNSKERNAANMLNSDFSTFLKSSNRIRSEKQTINAFESQIAKKMS